MAGLASSKAAATSVNASVSDPAAKTVTDALFAESVPSVHPRTGTGIVNATSATIDSWAFTAIRVKTSRIGNAIPSL